MTNRRRFIIDMVEKYKKDYKSEFSSFLELMEQRRAEMKDRKSGKLQGTSEMRNAVSIPDKLFNILSYVLNGVEEPSFLEPKGEIKWFIKKYKEFLLPKSY